MKCLGVIAVSLSIGLIGCSHPATSGDEEAASNLTGNAVPASALTEEEVNVPLDEVPESIRDAAEAAVPGIVFSEAERETENGVVVYDLEGTANGVEYEVEVSEDGEVLEVEIENDDDDDDD